jgi:creatinine amidohydrolase
VAGHVAPAAGLEHGEASLAGRVRGESDHFPPHYFGQIFEARHQPGMDMHAGEVETSTVMAHRPDLAHPERAREQSGADQARLGGLKDAYTAIWWHARFPNHYAGDGGPASPELGNLVLDAQADALAAMIRAVKADTKVVELQNRFFDEAEKPRETPQR